MSKETETLMTNRVNLFVWTIMSALAIWIGTSIQSQNVAMARLEVQQELMATTLDGLVEHSQHPFSEADVLRLEGRMDAAHDGINDRLRDIERE